MTSTVLAKPMIPAAAQTSAFTAAGGRIYPIDATSADIVATLPTAARQGATVTFTRADSSSHTATVQRGGSSDVINSGTGTATSITLTGQGVSITLVSDGAGHWTIAQQTGIGGGTYEPLGISAASRLQFVQSTEPVVVTDKNWGYGGPGNQTNTGGTGRSIFTTVAPCTGLQFEFGNWIATAGDSDGSNQITIACRATIGGTQYRVTFGGQRTAILDRGGLVRTDPLDVEVAAGATITLDVYVTPTSGGTIWPAVNYYTSTGEGWTAGSDLTAPGAAAPTVGVAFVYMPQRILGRVASFDTVKSVAFDGDSIANGTGDGPPGYGPFARAFTGTYAYVGLGVAGETAQQTAGAHHRRYNALRGVRNIIQQHGINDLQNSRTLAQTQADLITCWMAAARMNPLARQFQTTITPKSASTDSWATVGNQTTDATVQPVRLTLNAWIRAGAPLNASTKAAVAIGTGGALLAGQAGHPLYGYLEFADLFESARDSGKWKAGYTADGLHPNPTGAAAGAAALDKSQFA